MTQTNYDAFQEGVRVKLPTGFYCEGTIVGRLDSISKLYPETSGKIDIPLKRPTFWVQPDRQIFQHNRPILFWPDEIKPLIETENGRL